MRAARVACAGAAGSGLLQVLWHEIAAACAAVHAVATGLLASFKVARSIRSHRSVHGDATRDGSETNGGRGWREQQMWQGVSASCGCDCEAGATPKELLQQLHELLLHLCTPGRRYHEQQHPAL